MATVTDALKSLNIDDWYLRGDPQNEDEFNDCFSKIILLKPPSVKLGLPDNL